MNQGQIGYEELRDEALRRCGISAVAQDWGGESTRVAIDTYHRVLQSYLSDKVIIPREMIRKARVNNDAMCALCQMLSRLLTEEER